MNWLRLIRWKNLLIVFFTQFVVWYCLIFDPNNFLGFLRFVDLLLLSGSTMCIAAAGYIINDYFDIKIDLINRPASVTLEKSIPLRYAIIGHVVFNITGLVLAASLAKWIGHMEWLMMQVVCIVLLWFYSTHFKRQYVLGNIIVALLTALTIIVIWVYEPAMRMYYKYPGHVSVVRNIAPRYIIAGYATFAFLLTWIREIVKDMEDLKGDLEQGCTTLPIVKGLGYALRFAQVIAGVVTATVAVCTFVFFVKQYYILGVYTAATILIPLLVWIWFAGRQQTSRHYKLCSRWLKFIMLSGVFSLIVYHFSN